MLNFHGNGNETAASLFLFRIFFFSLPFSLPSFFGFTFLFAFPLKHALCDECDRISTRTVLLPSHVSFVRSTSFHLLDYHVLFCPRKKHSPVTIFRWKTERSTFVFLSRKQSCSKWCTQILTQSIKSTILRVTSVLIDLQGNFICTRSRVESIRFQLTRLE